MLSINEKTSKSEEATNMKFVSAQKMIEEHGGQQTPELATAVLMLSLPRT